MSGSLGRSSSYSAMLTRTDGGANAGGVGAAWRAAVSTAHANAQARRSINAHARRLNAARQYRDRELPDGWQKGRFYGPASEEQRQQQSAGMVRQGSAPVLTGQRRHRPPPAAPHSRNTPPTGPPHIEGTTPPTVGTVSEPVPAFGAGSGRFL